MAISQNFPDVRPSLNLNFARSKTLDPRITFERASIGTYVDENGLIKTAAADEARFDHDPVTGESLGLLIEEQRTNLYPHSYLISNWSIKNGTFTDNYAISPDGTQNATRVVATNTDPYFYYNMAQSAGTYTLSIWVKGIGSSVGKIAQIRLGGTPYKQFTIPSEWTRFSHTLTYANSFQSNIGFEIPDTNAQSGDEVYVWGAQLEQGSFPTSYIPTSGSTLTRQPDNANITGTNFTEFFNSSEGTFFGECDRYRQGAVPNSIAVVNNGGTDYANSLIFAELYDDSAAIGRCFTAGATYSERSQFDATLSISSQQGLFNRYSFAYKQDNFASTANNLIATDSSGNLPDPSSLTSLRIMRGWTNVYAVNGHLKQLRYYPERLTNAQLQNLTK